LSWFTTQSGGVRSGGALVAGAAPESTTLRRTTLHLRGPLPWTDQEDGGYSVNVLVPKVEIEQSTLADGNVLSLQGLGDVSVYVESRKASNWNWLAGLSLPTGEDAKSPGPGLIPPSLLQLGSGTFDPMVGLLYQDDDGGSLVKAASALYIFPLGESDGGLQAGRTLRVLAGGYWRTGTRVNPSLQLEMLNRDADRLNGGTLADTGSTMWTLVPSLSSHFGEAGYVQVSWRLPLVQEVTGTQLIPGTGFTIEAGFRF
jgi:hypothetical protein